VRWRCARYNSADSSANVQHCHTFINTCTPTGAESTTTGRRRRSKTKSNVDKTGLLDITQALAGRCITGGNTDVSIQSMNMDAIQAAAQRLAAVSSVTASSHTHYTALDAVLTQKSK
jgi:hypothetical protein